MNMISLVFFIFCLSLQASADICSDLRTELEIAIAKVPAPGGQFYLAMPDGKTCSLATGQFELTSKNAMTPASPMKVWSISKTFTHVAILKLVELGKLDLNQSLRSLESRYPELYQGLLKHYPNGEKIMIRHLLSHTSGIVDYMTLPKYLNHWDQAVLPGEIILVASQNQDAAVPGSVSRYSNTSMMILARIIEVITKSNYESFIQSQVLVPIGLSQSSFATQSSGWGAVHGYSLNRAGQYFEVTHRVSPSMVWGTGALVSTAAEIGKWFASVLTANVLSPSMTAAVFKPVTLNDGSEAEYGLGFHFERFSNGFELIGHGGGPLEGNSATMLYSPQLRTLIVVAANGASENANAVLGAIGWKRVAEYFKGSK